MRPAINQPDARRTDGTSTITTMGVCLTGELRWFGLTLSSLQVFLLQALEPHSYRLYHVGPRQPLLHGAERRTLHRMGADIHDVCHYDPNITFEWGAGNDTTWLPSGPFERHGPTPSADATLPYKRKLPRSVELRFDARWLPIFRRCLLSGNTIGPTAPLGFPKNVRAHSYNRIRSRPCAAGVSLIIQLWQSTQCLTLMNAAENRWRAAGQSLWHETILRLRADIFFFRPIALPRPSQQQGPLWYSFMEETCQVSQARVEATFGNARGRFLQDFWMYGSREVMNTALSQPLQHLLNTSLQYLEMQFGPTKSKGTPKCVPIT